MEAGYFKTAWEDIRHSPGWFGKCCVLGLLSFIPVFGSIVTNGYCYGWARDIAWDVHRPMPNKVFGNEDGKLYSRGFFALVMGWIVVFIVGLIGKLLTDVPGNLAIQYALTLLLTVFVGIGIMRMAIYGRFSACFQVGKMWKMLCHDPKGILRIIGMVLLVGLIGNVALVAVGMVMIVIAFATGFASASANGITISYLSSMFSHMDYLDASQLQTLVNAILPIMGVLAILFVLLVFACLTFGSWLTMLSSRALGYWTRQFEVAKWGGMDDPLPFEGTQAAAAAAAAQPAQPQPPVQEAPAAQPVQQAPAAQPVQTPVVDPQPSPIEPIEPIAPVQPVELRPIEPIQPIEAEPLQPAQEAQAQAPAEEPPAQPQADGREAGE